MLRLESLDARPRTASRATRLQCSGDADVEAARNGTRAVGPAGPLVRTFDVLPAQLNPRRRRARHQACRRSARSCYRDRPQGDLAAAPRPPCAQRACHCGQSALSHGLGCRRHCTPATHIQSREGAVAGSPTSAAPVWSASSATTLSSFETSARSSSNRSTKGTSTAIRCSMRACKRSAILAVSIFPTPAKPTAPTRSRWGTTPHGRRQHAHERRQPIGD